MSGRRRKALRRAFTAEHGRPPEGARFSGYNDKREAVFAQHDEMRPIKKAYTRGRR